MGRTSKESGFDTGGREDFPLCHGIESGAHMTLYAMDNKDFSPRLIGSGYENGHSPTCMRLGLHETLPFWKDDKVMFLQQTVAP